jgi:hypothetical protein
MNRIGCTIHSLLKKKAPIYVISHERSGTHLAINLLYRNLHIDQSFHDLINWKGDINNEEGRISYWKYMRRDWDKISKCGGIIKSHCDAYIYEKYLPKSNVVYVVRDPRDTLVSFYHYLNKDEFHKNNPGLEDLRSGSFGEFLRRPLHPYLRYGFSIEGGMENVVDRWARHARGWFRMTDVCVVDYEKLIISFRKSMLRVAFKIHTFPKIKMRGYALGEPGSILPRKGVAGDWKTEFSKADQLFLSERLNRYSIDMARWN